MRVAGRVVDRQSLDRLYCQYNCPECAERDPVRFARACQDPAEREVVGLLAAVLAYGRLEQVLRSVEDILQRLDGAPRRFVLSHKAHQVRAACEGFRHRFADAGALSALLCAVGEAVRAHGSLHACFLLHDKPSSDTVLPGLTGLARELGCAGGAAGHLLPDPARGSACKRLNLYLRWMVRQDAVDPGGWKGAAASRLIVPLDAHVWRVCRQLGLTRRGSCDMRAALEVTESFRRLCPEDPVRYDFALMHASRDKRLTVSEDGRLLLD